MTISDEKHSALQRVLLRDGQINDLEQAWLLDRLEQVEPYTGGRQINDLWDALLTSEGIEGNGLPERKLAYFERETGQAGTARPDVELLFWSQL